MKKYVLIKENDSYIDVNQVYVLETVAKSPNDIIDIIAGTKSIQDLKQKAKEFYESSTWEDADEFEEAFSDEFNLQEHEEDFTYRLYEYTNKYDLTNDINELVEQIKKEKQIYINKFSEDKELKEYKRLKKKFGARY